jgi:serine protease Do
MMCMRSCSLRGLAALALALTFASYASADDLKPFARRSPIVEAVAKTRASIVCIRVPRPGGGKDMIGTGVIVDERGIIVTNRHVVGPNRTANIALCDGTTISSKDVQVLYGDAGRDLAIIRVNTSHRLHALPLGPANDLMVGETVIAIGHPFGYDNTVSTGIISALDREITMPTQDVMTGLIQITAAINPGNSGGPLLNINGELIGINVALREGAQNIAFAINAGDVKRFLSQHLNALKVSGVYHGLQCEEKVIAETGDRQRVVVHGAPESAGVKNGDELRTVGDVRVMNAFDVERALWGRRPGEQVALTVVRDGHEMTVTLTLAAGSGAGQVANIGPTSTGGATTGAVASAPR